MTWQDKKLVEFAKRVEKIAAEAESLRCESLDLAAYSNQLGDNRSAQRFIKLAAVFAVLVKVFRNPERYVRG